MTKAVLRSDDRRLGPARPRPAPRSEAAVRARILVVDDAPVNRELMAVMLDAVGCELAFAEDGGQAVEMAAFHPYDLILMDMQMPVMDGLAAARRIRASAGPNAATPILAVSANVQPMHIEACAAAGMDDHVPKPIGSHSLISKVAYWLSEGQGS